MTKHRPLILPGLDSLLQKQAEEMATLRAARSERRAKQGERTPKRYRLGPQDSDGSVSVDVTDRGVNNWRERERCANLELARQRLQQLTADDTTFFRAASTPSGGKPGT
jgi:ribosomal protein L15E